MKKITLLAMAVAMVFTGAAQATSIGDGGVALQGVLDGITVGGSSSVDVNTDQMTEGGDAYWELTATGGSVNTIVLTLGANVQGEFGVYDMKDPLVMVALFDQNSTAGAQRLFSLTDQGDVEVNTVDTGVDFVGNAFGYYLTIGNVTIYSDTALNGGQDRMIAYQGEGDAVKLPMRPVGEWSDNEFIFAWETDGLFNGITDGGQYSTTNPSNFTDFVVMAESIKPVPEPASLALLGLGLAGLAVRRSRKKC